MCGIFGILTPEFAASELLDQLRSMSRLLHHRGPDGEGFFTEPRMGGIGASRLSIIDPEGGQQPIFNEGRTLALVLNGEIYNFLELRADLEKRGHRFRSHTDGEVIVHLFEEEGIECVQKLRGMFAFALMDLRRRCVYLVRDRLGKKPLCYLRLSEFLLFASEAKALFVHPAAARRVNPGALEYFLTFGYVPAPMSMFQDVAKLQPGHILKYADGVLTVTRYWEPRPGRPEESGPEFEEAIAGTMREAVRLRLRSDVPIGIFLSGGIDSSIVTGLAAESSPGRIKTFSIDFDSPQHSEAVYARTAARRFGTDHHPLLLKNDAIDSLPRLVWHFDEPFADSSAIATYHLARLASQHVKVVLSGDGGDELFGGYQRRYSALVAAAGMKNKPCVLNRILPRLARMAQRVELDAPWNRVRAALEILDRPLSEVYIGMVGMYAGAADEVLASVSPRANRSYFDLFVRHLDRSREEDLVNALCLLDVQTYLPNDLLVKIDIASMANSLEVRCPFLDHELAELAFRIPGALKLRKTNSKYILRKTFGDLLPPKIRSRGKQGFGVPLKRWMKSWNHEMVYDVLASGPFRQRGYFKPRKISELVHQHRRGTADHSARLWLLLILELWHRSFIDPVEIVRTSSGA